MHVISFQNCRGGNGKTTLAVNLAAELAANANRVLLIDLDPNGDATASLAVPQSATDASSADLLTAPDHAAANIEHLIWNISSNLSIIPASNTLLRLDTNATPLAASPTRDQRVRMFVNQQSQEYDYVLIDTPSCFGVLTLNALFASDTVFVPVRVDAHAARSSTRYRALCAAALGALRPAPPYPPEIYEIPCVAGPLEFHEKAAGDFLQHMSQRLIQDPDGSGPLLVPFDPSIDRAAALGEPIRQVTHDSAYAYACRSLAEYLQKQHSNRVPLSLNPENLHSTETDEPRLSISTSRPELAPDEPRTSLLSEVKPAARRTARHDQDGITGRAAELAARVDHVKRTTRQSDARRLSDPRVRIEMERSFQVEQKPNAAKSLFGVRSTSRGLLFIIDAPRSSSVTVAGTFNTWTEESTHFNETLNAHEILISAPVGTHQYRVYVDGDCVEISGQDSVDIPKHGVCGVVQANSSTVLSPGVKQLAS